MTRLWLRLDYCLNLRGFAVLDCDSIKISHITESDKSCSTKPIKVVEHTHTLMRKHIPTASTVPSFPISYGKV